MKRFNWPAVVDQLRNAMCESTTIISEKDNKGLLSIFRSELLNADTFHPVGMDRYLDRALVTLPKRCDYRKISSYWGWKAGREKVTEALYDCIAEMEENIRWFFSNPMNFPPGYFPPEEIRFLNADDLAEKYTSRVITASKQP